MSEFDLAEVGLMPKSPLATPPPGDEASTRVVAPRRLPIMR
jgi:hypothetical protein